MFSRAADRALGVSVAIVAVVALCLVAGAVLLATTGQSPQDRAAALAELTVPTTTAAAPATPVAPAAPVTDAYRPDGRWLVTTAQATGIPERALAAYARAHLQISAEQPGCEVAWNTIAALGAVESAHGTMAGDTVLGDDGRSTPAILGPRLDGSQFAAIRDTDGGALDGDAEWDRAVGPMQFIPSTWADWAADADGDGVADPHQIDDAALAAGRYLCHSGRLDTAEAWRRAIYSYNHSDEYVTDIATIASDYAARVA